VRQPLIKMGQIAAETVIRMIEQGQEQEYPAEIAIEPTLACVSHGTRTEVLTRSKNYDESNNSRWTSSAADVPRTGLGIVVRHRAR